jgi:hypothetical protein
MSSNSVKPDAASRLGTRLMGGDDAGGEAPVAQRPTSGAGGPITGIVA